MKKITLKPFFLALFTLLFVFRILFMSQANLLVEEAYYWNYSEHLDFSFLDHPPMVAFLIKLGTFIFNVNEWGVRFATILCWIVTGYFSYKLSELIREKAGFYAVILLAILPFFFIHSLIITPDIPLIMCWSAALYYLYQAIILECARSWYKTGLWIGFGLLSKYTIVLLGLATIIYLMTDSKSRKWFFRKEPYYCALIAFVIFTPVIYWNATHHWVSFLFQTSRRFHDYYSFSFHTLIALTLIYLTPTGILGAFMLFSPKYSNSNSAISVRVTYFLQIYNAVPLLFFAVFSLFHGIKINWIGPIFLAMLPWLALQLADNQQILGITFRTGWTISSIIIVFIYSAVIYGILADKPKMDDYLFKNAIAWNKLTEEIYNIAQRWEKKTGKAAIIIPLDIYNIGSEYAFYQQKYLNQGVFTTSYKVVGSHVFGYNSLMYQYWGNSNEIKDKDLLIISPQFNSFENLQMSTNIIPLSKIKRINYRDKKHNSKTFYYQLIRVDSDSISRTR